MTNELYYGIKRSFIVTLRGWHTISYQLIAIFIKRNAFYFGAAEIYADSYHMADYYIRTHLPGCQYTSSSFNSLVMQRASTNNKSDKRLI